MSTVPWTSSGRSSTASSPGSETPRPPTGSPAGDWLECDHGRLKARLRPMRGLKQDRSAGVVIAGHALVQGILRGHYELAVEEPTNRRLAVAFEELILAI
jgi:hypothetical protein